MEKESTRQLKVARQIQKDLSEIFAREVPLPAGVMVSVTVVRVSPDLALAKVFLSIFPFARVADTMAVVEKEAKLVRRLLGVRVKNQLRIVPELAFEVDDSLEYIEKIDNLLR